MRTKQHLKVSAILVLAAAALTANGQWTVVDLHPPGATNSSINAIEGDIQVGSVTQSGVERATMWAGNIASLVDLHPVGATRSRVWAVSGNRQGGEAYYGTYPEAAIWFGTPGSYVNLNAAPYDGSQVRCMSANHEYGRAFQEFLPQYAMRWQGTPGSATPFGGAQEAVAIHGVFENQVFGYTSTPGGNFAQIWNANDLNAPPILLNGGSLECVALAVHAGRQGGSFEYRACMWSGTPSSLVILGPPPPTRSSVQGIHEGRQVGYIGTVSAPSAALWTGTQASFVDLHAQLGAGFLTSQANGVWDDGEHTYVVGWKSLFANGQQRNAVMWVGPTALALANDLIISAGTVVGGGLPEILKSDDTTLNLRPGPVLATSVPPVRILVSGQSPTETPSWFSFSIEGNATSSNLQQLIYLLNFNTLDWELMYTGQTSSQDLTIQVDGTGDLSRFVEPGTRLVRSKITYRQTGPSLVFPWTVRVDKAHWIIPQY